VGLTANGRLGFGLVPVEQKPLSVDLPENSVVEASPAGKAAAASIARRLVAEGGAALIVDYGSAAPGTGDTLQAVKAHKYVDPLAEPGEADLTAHVDFQALARAAEAAGARARGIMRQGEFLIRMGLVDRANVLGRGKDTKTRDAIASAIDRLAGPKGMGDLFKVLALSAPELKLPIFDPIMSEQTAG
jgi:SAM-dependent MidA family methyltransferase